MELYIQVENNHIKKCDVVENEVCNIKVSGNSVEELLKNLEKWGKVDDEIEEKIREFFDGESIRESIHSYNIKHWVSNRSFGELIDMYNSGEIKKPAMQREFVWDAQKSSRLIESIILGLPIPPLFLLEVGNNEYELVDGFQRLTTVTNYVNGAPWNSIPEKKRKIKSRLSGQVLEELVGKTFAELSPEHQRIIKRSTIPLIEFRQIGPKDYSSKYLIFERINTGSVKLNSMQIRKALAYGAFMNSLYEIANSCEKMKKIFSDNALKKDFHVEAVLRVIVMTDIYYNSYKVEKLGIKNILNYYCEKNKNKKIDNQFLDELNNAMDLMMDIFEDDKNIFRRVEKNEDGKIVFTGNLNISILEAMMGVAIKNKILLKKVDPKDMREAYKETMYTILKKSFDRKEENPFSESTGTLKSICRRFEICEKILM